jgi:DNA primase
VQRIDVEKIRADYRLSDAVSRRTKLRKAGRNKVGLCPFHNERSPSFYVYDATDGYHCFGCGANGDIIKFVMETERVDFPTACNMITSGDLPVVPEAEKAKAAEEDAAERAAAIDLAHGVWEDSRAADGTPAETYLRSRGITILPKRFRFVLTPTWYDMKTGECGKCVPALVCLITDVADDFLGVQRIFLRDGGRAKANMKNPKLSLGRPAGGAIRIGPPREHVTMVEGPEDGASVAQELGRDQSVWVACGTSMMPRMVFPPEVRKLTIGGDNNKAGRAAAQAAKVAQQQRGLEVRAVYPDDAFGDWNDQLRGIRK